jgi:hypothetical protein
MNKNARRFLQDEVVTYYQQTIAPELYCLGVRSESFIPLLEELAQEISADLTLSDRQQEEFLTLLMDIGVAIFESDRAIDLKAYKMRLQDYLARCRNQVFS